MSTEQIRAAAEQKYGCRWDQIHNITREDFESGWIAAQSQDESSNLGPDEKEKIIEHVMNLYYSRDGESLRRWLQESM